MDERIWTNTSPEPGQRADYPGLTVTCDAPVGAQMISGDLEAALAVLAPGAPVLGCGAPAPQGPHAIRVARDRAILVTPAPLVVQPGWHGSYALSLADDLYATIILSGPRADEIASACTATPLDGSSASAATLFAGVGALVTRRGGTLAVRVQWPEAASLWAALARLAGA
jgi:hypothetical protein